MAIDPVILSPTQVPSQEPPQEPPKKLNKKILIALSAIAALGMLFAYLFSAPWLIIVGFFALALVPLFPLGKIVDDQRHRDPEPIRPVNHHN